MNLTNSCHHVQVIAGLVAVSGIVLGAAGCKETTTSSEGDRLTDPSLQPVVVSTLPGSGSTGPFSFYNRGDGASKPHFVITFNKLMHKGSFTPSSFRIQGFDRPVLGRVEGNYYYVIYGNKTPSTSSMYFRSPLSTQIITTMGVP